MFLFQVHNHKSYALFHNPSPLLLSSLPTELTPSLPGLLLRPPRHSEQTLPKLPQHHPRALIRLASRVLRRLPPRIARPRQLDPPALWLQSDFYLGLVLVWRRQSDRLALYLESVFWRFLCGYFCHWKWTGQFGDGGQSVYYRLWTAEVFGD